jgi:hypothetical protein
LDYALPVLALIHYFHYLTSIRLLRFL